MYFFPMDFQKLTPDGVRFETGAIISAISEADLKKNQTRFKRSNKRHWTSAHFFYHGIK